jgi:hypothetical protein
LKLPKYISLHRLQIRYRRDDDHHTLRRCLGQIGVVRTDLIPILRDFYADTELFDMSLRLMVSDFRSGATEN